MLKKREKRGENLSIRLLKKQFTCSEELRESQQVGERRHKDTNSSGWRRRQREKSA